MKESNCPTNDSCINIKFQLEANPINKKNGDFFIVGIGASAGGLEALEQFFRNMPSNNNIGFVVIQHLSPDYKSFMPDILSRSTKMKIYEIRDEIKIEPGCIYLNPPKCIVSIFNDHLYLKEQKPLYKTNFSINAFFESLAKGAHERAIGIILSGTGSDGTLGCRAIKESGGIILAQDTETAKFNGMPSSVISAHICDVIASPKDMPEKILNYTNHSSLISEMNDSKQKTEETTNTLSQIYDYINKQNNVDFSLYKQSSVLRCMDRRIRICQIPTLNEYLTYLKESPKELDSLFNSLLIGITRFFRDQDAFEVLKDKIIPQIMNSKADNGVVRVWVAGCSTGEEAYSLAILFKEYMDSVQRYVPVKIFATDLDYKAIEFANKGIYQDSIAQDVSLERLNRFFIKKRDGYHISKHVREMVIFSVHNMISNPPFYKLDLLSCRNLLIYFNTKLQNRIISNFQFALEPGGFMFLGSSETPGELSNYFSTYDAKWKIFYKKDVKRRPLVDDLSIIPSGIASMPPSDGYLTQFQKNNLQMDDLYTHLIESCLPPCVIVDENNELMYVWGDCDKFLKVPKGNATNNILKMVPEEISTALGAAINKVIKEKKKVIYTNLRIHFNKNETYINFTVKPLFTKKNGLMILVIFEEVINDNSVNQESSKENFDTINKLHERIADLEQELQYTKENLQTSIEEIETSSEELQSANEELLVSNEEMHSTNEELQSTNQELMVVNTQNQYKIQELEDLNNDMINFLNSTTIGTLFLDSDYCIRKFTPSITKEINLLEQDIGRPISHISHNLEDVDLIVDSKEVMNSLTQIEKEIKTQNNRWYIIKYSPYRTSDNIIKGVVISLVDITSRKKAEDELKRGKAHYERLVELSPFTIIILHEGRIVFSNTSGLELFQVREIESLIGKPINKLLDLKTETSSEQNNQEAEITRQDGSKVYVDILSMPFPFIEEEEDSQLLVIRDITSQKKEKELLLDNEKQKKIINETFAMDELKKVFFSNLSHELRTPLNVIMSTLQLLESDTNNTNKNLSKLYGIMKQNCYRQLRLVNNMIDITKIDSGFFEIKLQNHDIISVIETITLSVTDYIKNKGVELIFDTNVEEKVIACDLDSIERIILNLLSNAIKFTDPGGSIAVNIIVKKSAVSISVKDTGTGIPKEKSALIFDRFRQGDKNLDRPNEGSGIGLSLVKSLVELHGGKIDVISEYEKGTEFIIEIPSKIVSEEEIITKEKSGQYNNVEKINIEFADIYNLH